MRKGELMKNSYKKAAEANKTNPRFVPVVSNRYDCKCMCRCNDLNTGQLAEADQSGGMVSFAVMVFSSCGLVLTCHEGVEFVAPWMDKHRAEEFPRDKDGRIPGAWPFNQIPVQIGFYVVLAQVHSASADKITLGSEVWFQSSTDRG